LDETEANKEQGEIWRKRKRKEKERTFVRMGDNESTRGASHAGFGIFQKIAIQLLHTTSQLFVVGGVFKGGDS